MTELKATFELWLEITAWDKAGQIVHHEREPSRSPVQQFLEIVLSQLKGINIAVTDTSDASVTLDYDRASSIMKATGPANNASQGIVIGTDATAVDITDNKLVAQIANGGGAGQMLHQLETMDSVVTIADPDATFEMSRSFINNSGGSITVKETGIYALAYETGGTGKYICLVRDVPTELVVPDGGACQVTYTLKITE